MKFYKIILKGLPEVVFAHNYKTARHNMSMAPQNSFIEITHVVQGDLICNTQEGGYALTEKSIHCFMYDKSCSFYSQREHEHNTVGLRLAYEKKIITAQEVLALWQSSFDGEKAGADTVIIPDIITDSRYVNEISQTVRKIIRISTLSTHVSALNAMSKVYELFQLLTDYSINLATVETRGISYGDTLYCTKATAYISEHISEQISVPQIAKELRISIGHLSRIFHAVMGMSIISYTNKLKMEHAKQLLRLDNSDLSEIASQLGISDEKYFCRLFKKHIGITTSEFRNSFYE